MQETYSPNMLSNREKEAGYITQANFQSAINNKPHTQEIPEQMERVAKMLADTAALLSNLHQKLASVMPPSAPEASGSLSAGKDREPASPLGNQLAEFVRLADQNNKSLSYLIDRIKL